MSNKTSEHGGFITEGTVSHGTLRPQDLLRAFADEVARISPFNTAAIVGDAREIADRLDEPSVSVEVQQEADEVLTGLFERFEEYAGREGRGLYFGALEGDASDFGFWSTGEDEAA